MRNVFGRPISLVFSLVVVWVGCLLANGIQTGGGNVKIKDVRFVGDNGNQLSALLYLPADLDPKKPRPAVLTMHGYINSREVQDAFDIEFARRGYVVFSMDMEGHGYSEQSPLDPTIRGALAGLSYLRNLAFVDKDKIALEGHSMGGWSTLSAAGAKPEWVNTVIQEGSSPETFFTPKVLKNTPFNYAIVFSKYDEFAPLMWEVPEAPQIVGTAKLKNAFGTTESVVPGKLYGSFADKSARMLYIPPVIHPADHWSKAAVGNAVDFLNQAMPAPKPIAYTDQVWRWKEYGTLLALIGALMFLLSVAGNMLRTSYFRSMTVPIPESKGASGPGWRVGALIGAAIPAVTFFKFQEWGAKWFPVSSFWPQSLTNGFVVWVGFNAVIAVILFAAWHYASNKKTGAAPIHYGVSYSPAGLRLHTGSVGKALLLAVCSVGAVYVLTLLASAIFHLDFRIWIIALKVMSWHQFLMMLAYVLPFLLFFTANGIVLHGQFRLRAGSSETHTAWKWFFANFAINTLGIIVLILIQYIPLFATGRLFWPAESLLGIVAFQFVPVNLTVALISTYLYRRTGTIYAGAFVNAFLVTWYIVAGQATQYVGVGGSNGWPVAIVAVLAAAAAGFLFARGRKATALPNVRAV